MNDGVAMNDQINAVEDLMKIQREGANKGEIFECYKARFMEHFA